MIKTLCLQIPLVDAIKIPPYSKYMKDIVTNKRKIPNDAITAMLANYSFEGKFLEKRGDTSIPTEKGMSKKSARAVLLASARSNPAKRDLPAFHVASQQHEHERTIPPGSLPALTWWPSSYSRARWQSWVRGLFFAFFFFNSKTKNVISFGRSF